MEATPAKVHQVKVSQSQVDELIPYISDQHTSQSVHHAQIIRICENSEEDA